ncbi:MAG: zinc ribbon domain-containing protein [Sedimentisphaerales bacterium]|jgi:hypothetical protein
MNKPTSNLINIIATGIVVTVLFSLSLFWGRFFFWGKLISKLPAQSFDVIIRPSGLVPGEPAPQQANLLVQSQTEPPGPNEPNFRFSQVYASRNTAIVIGSAIGASWDIMAEVFPYRDINERVYYWYEDKNKNYLCLDKRSGLIIRNYESFEPNDKGASREAEFFAGPNGISETASASLGRFYDPIVTEGWDPNRIGLYDKRMRRFYVIDFAGGSVSKGLQLAQGDRREPIATCRVGGIEKWHNNRALNVVWDEPEVEKGQWKKSRLFLSGGAQSSERYSFIGREGTYKYIPVLDKTGRIYIYNTKEESFVQAGYLPVPQSLFKLGQQSEIANPRNVLAYEVMPVYAILRLPADPNKPPENFDVKYLGMNVACASREGTTMAVAVFDPNGKLVYRGDSKSNGISTVEYMYSAISDEPVVTEILFLLENLQPPVFEIASYLCGDIIEASAGHRALFVLPNSFMGMLGRAGTEKFLEKQFLALALMGPSLILSVWLAFRVRKDATIVGLSGTAKTWWAAGTIAFGLSAYITYRLTRHKEVLITCQNCGRLRRPDMETCHHCGSKWEIPELTPPNWRICD